MKDKNVIEMEKEEVKEEVKESTVPIGNYIVEVISEGKIIKKIAVANAEINITKIADGGLTVDLE